MNEFGWLVEDSDGEDRDVTFVVGPTIDHQFSIPADAVKTQEFWNLMIGWKALFADQLARVIEARNLSTEIIDMASDNIGSNSR